MDTVNEKTTAWLTTRFKDKAGQPALPATVSYRIDDVATGLPVRASTTVTAAAEVEITLTAVDNAILNTNGDNETRRVTIIATYGAGDQITTEHLYEVINLSKVS